MGGKSFSTPQVPSTLPTLDEVLGYVKPEEVAGYYAGLLHEGLNVHTIHTEMEGGMMHWTFSDFLDRYSGEIFSALSLAGTILLAWLARRGLLPAMRAGLDGLAAGVDRLNDCARDAGERQSRLLSDLLSDAEPVLRDLSGMRDLFAALSERTAELEKKTAEAASENEKLLALHRASVEMLKEVFTAAKLPVTSKEELAAIYRRALDAAGDGGEVEP